MESIVIGNTFPMTLIRGHRVIVEELPVGRIRELAAGCAVHSFWGHANSLAAAEAIVGAPLAPRTERPALVLNGRRLPTLDGEPFSVCYVLSPDYAEAMRPAIGEEYTMRQIVGWHLLRLHWVDASAQETHEEE